LRFIVFFPKKLTMEIPAMKRWLLPIAVVVALSLCAAIAGDFWKSKKFATWSDEETKKMIEDSPWARQVPIKYIFTPGRGGPGRGGMPPGGMGGGMPPGGMGGGGGAGGGGGFGQLGPPKQEIQTPKATLRWQSSLPVKQAMARMRYKDEVEKSEDAAKSLSRQEGQYILSVSGVMGGPNATPDILKAGATLKIGNLDPIPPADVLIDRTGMMVTIYFAFPKAQPGAHIIEAKDKSLEFQLKTPSVELKGKFSLDDMVYQSKLEI
jgi:hypothetical protein